MPYLAKVSDRPEPATEHQIKAVDEIGFPGDASKLTKGQASAVLSARDYFEGVLYAKIGDTSNMPADKLLIVNLMTAFILKHEGVRNRAIAWNRRSYQRGMSGTHGGVPKPRQDEYFAFVEKELTRLVTTYRV